MLLFGALSINRCTKQAQDSSIAKIDTILVIRHDTLVRLDSVLKVKVKYIDTSRIDTVHEILDHYIPIDTSDNDGNQVIAANQLREAIKWKDSLNTCLEMRNVDSVALDSISSIAKEKPQQNWSLIDRAMDFGTGILVGAGIRSLF